MGVLQTINLNNSTFKLKSNYFELKRDNRIEDFPDEEFRIFNRRCKVKVVRLEVGQMWRNSVNVVRIGYRVF